MTADPQPHATSVIIVNFRTKELTLEAVRSALREPEVQQILVVDNASGDGSAELIETSLPAATVRVIRAPANLGFGRAVNLAAREATSDLLLLLNSDATIVQGSTARLAAALLGDASTGVVAPAVFEADGHTLQPGAFGRFPQLVSNPFRRATSEVGDSVVEWVSGVAMMLRKSDFHAIGGFDERFEMYLEDVDLCRRLTQLGKAVRREPAAGVIHLGGQSWRSSVDKRRQYHRSKITYFQMEGLGPLKAGLLHALRAGRVGSAWIASGARRRPLIGRKR
jgi:N-acetylglucosaminyl-diphospho-decaprenol L-rhamnosyltransferase